MSLKVKCTYCGKHFNTDKVNLKTRKIGKGIEITYYECPKCKTEFIVMRTNPEIRFAQAKLQKFIDRLKGKPEGATPDDVFHVVLLQRDFKEKLDAFNGR